MTMPSAVPSAGSPRIQAHAYQGRTALLDATLPTKSARAALQAPASPHLENQAAVRPARTVEGRSPSWRTERVSERRCHEQTGPCCADRGVLRIADARLCAGQHPGE